MEPRAADLELIAQLRSARIEAVKSSAVGSLSLVLTSATTADAFVYVVKLLDVHPALGKVAGRKVLESMGLSHFTRVADLNSAQISTLLEACGEPA